MSEFLFPRKLARRDFLSLSVAGVGAFACGASLRAADDAKTVEAKPTETKTPVAPVTIGSGKATYTLDESWGKLPHGQKYGFGCAVVVDAKDNVYVTTRLKDMPVVIFDKHGALLESWGKGHYAAQGEDCDKFVATAHGLYHSKEPGGEFLYWTDNVAKQGDAKIGARVVKTDLAGKILYQLGNVEKESDTSQKLDLTNPTDVAVAPNGDIYIVDGYGSQKLHRFDKNFKHIKTIGGKGKDHGQFSTNHGVWINTLKKEPELYIADRANNRLEVFSPELEYKRTIEDVRNPCCFYQHEGQLWIPELNKRVTILDVDDKVVAHLGDGTGIDPKTIEDHPDKFATPHALTLSSTGDLYILEWLPYGRVRKFKHTPV
ncbi:MAG: hypothetical protein QM811_22230 [Pirellulales bacterium]